MANNYLEFSEVIDNLTPEEMDWWENEAYKVDAEDDDFQCCDYDIKRDERTVWFHADESGNLEAVDLVVTEFLKKFRPNEYFALTWSCGCSKPRIGEFGGGAMFVTAKGTKYTDSYTWLELQKQEWSI